MLQIKRLFTFPAGSSRLFSSIITTKTPKKEDELFKQIELEIRAHDREVLSSYCKFVVVIFLVFL